MFCFLIIFGVISFAGKFFFKNLPLLNSQILTLVWYYGPAVLLFLQKAAPDFQMSFVRINVGCSQIPLK
jgi:hypothetical protein